jgi:hypothetical protein
MLDTSFHLFITATTTTRGIFKESKRSKHVDLTVSNTVKSEDDYLFLLG